jgi:preprotein translocase subunit SecG
MEQVILVFYVLLAAAMVGLILIQQGKGADVGASFGAGASQTVFGSVGAGNVLTRSTAILATLFFVASIGLAVMAKHKAEAARTGGIPVAAEVQSGDNAAPSAGEVPAAPEAEDKPAAPASDIPSAGGEPVSAPAVQGAEEVPAGNDVPAAQGEQKQ